MQQHPTWAGQTVEGRGTVASWDTAMGAGTIAPLDGGEPLQVTRDVVAGFTPTIARRWPTLAAADLTVGERVAFTPDGNGGVTVAGPWPD